MHRGHANEQIPWSIHLTLPSPLSSPPPPGFHINSPHGRGILCRALHWQAWTLPAFLFLGLKLGRKPCTRSPMGVRSVLPVALDPLAVGIVVGSGSACLWNGCFSCGRLSLRPFGSGQRAPRPAHTTPLGFESPTPLTMNSPSRGAVLCVDCHFMLRALESWL